MKQSEMKPGHWYYITVEYCPVCGYTREFRERQYTPRPDEYQHRHHWKEVYDWCNELGG